MAMVHLPESPIHHQQEESNEASETPSDLDPPESATNEKADEEPKVSKDEEAVSDQNEASSAEASVSTSTTGTRSSASSSISSNSSSRPSSRGSEKNESISLPQHQYDKDELIKLSKTDLAKKWPDFLDPTFLNNTTGVWDPEKWFKNKRGSDNPADDARSKRERPAEFERDLSFKRRTPDPKERIKEERDDIVLSPQRRSFGTGCHVSQQTFPVTTTTRRPGSPNDSREPESLHRDTRRIGSGRIVSRDSRDKDHRDYGYGGRNNRFDRDEREKEPPGRYMGRYRANDRRMSRGRDDRIEEEEEPEWFSGGPTSQHETIELVGFDNPCNHDQKLSGRGRRGKELSRKSLMPTRLSDTSMKSHYREPEPQPQAKERETEPEKVEAGISSSSSKSNDEDHSDKKQDFDLNDIFKMDWIPGLLPNGTPPETADSNFTGSRFSQWFSRDSPIKDLLESEENSRRSSIQDEIRAQVLGIANRGPTPPHSSSGNYFIPINPPHGQIHFNHDHHHGPKDGKNILEILQNANINVTPLLNSENHTHTFKDEVLSGKVKSVVELEADLKQLVLGANRPTDDKSAFNKLLSQLSDQGATMSVPLRSMSMGPVDKFKVIQEEDLITCNFNARMMRQPTPPPIPPSVAKNQPIVNMPDLRVSPTPSPMYGMEKDLLVDLFKDMDHSAKIKNKSEGFSEGPMKEQEPNPMMVDMMRALYDQQGNQNEMIARLVAQQQHLQNQQNMQQNQQNMQQNQQNMQQNQQNMQQNRIFQSASPATFQNKLKPNDLMATQQQRPKFMSTLVPAPYGHILNPSPTPDPMGQTLGVPLAVGPHLSPRQSPLSHDLGAAVPGRIPSPLVFGQAPPILSHAPAPIHPSQVGINQANTLQVQNANALPRVPSPQELAAHTQTILQNALIKRKLEEQKENYRKRQEAQRSRSPNVTTPGLSKSPASSTTPTVTSSSSPSKFTSTMAAFTPTSVMRKMHSEKLDKENRSDVVSPQGKVPGSPEHIKIQSSISQFNSQQNGILIAGNSHGMSSHEIPQLHQQPDHSPQRLVSSGNTPRALYGQGIFGQQQSQVQPTPQRSQPVYTVQGRPIVKGSVPDTSEQIRGRSAINNSAPKVNMGPQHKQFTLPNQGNVLRPELDPFVAHLVEQRMMIGQQNLQRQMNVTANQKPAPNIPFYPRGTPMVTPHQNVLRPPVVNNTNENMNFFGRSGIFVPPPPALRGQTPNLSQILAYQQQQQKCAQNMKAPHQQQQQQSDQRTSMDPRSLSNMHPLALQQVFYNVQSQVAQGQGMLQLNNNIGMTGRPDGNFCGGANMKNQQLMPPGHQGGNRHSPVNLARWFGNDVLKQKMPDMPPVPMQNALSVEELERQQHTTVVHN